MKTLRAGLAAIASLFLVQPCAAQTSPDVHRGLVLVQTHCSECHAIDRVGPASCLVRHPFVTFTIAILSNTLRKPSQRASDRASDDAAVPL